MEKEDYIKELKEKAKKQREFLEEEELGKHQRMYEVLYNNMKVSDLPVSEFCMIIRGIVRDEISKNLPIYQVPEYKEFPIPNTPGEPNDNLETYITDHTIFDPKKFYK